MLGGSVFSELMVYVPGSLVSFPEYFSHSPGLILLDTSIQLVLYGFLYSTTEQCLHRSTIFFFNKNILSLVALATFRIQMFMHITSKNWRG